MKPLQLIIEIDGVRHSRPLAVWLCGDGELSARVQWRDGPLSLRLEDWLAADALLWDLLSPAQCERLLALAKENGRHE